MATVQRPVKAAMRSEASTGGELAHPVIEAIREAGEALQIAIGSYAGIDAELAAMQASLSRLADRLGQRTSARNTRAIVIPSPGDAIVAAAIRVQEHNHDVVYALPAPARHHTLLRWAAEAYPEPGPRPALGRDQGIHQRTGRIRDPREGTPDCEHDRAGPTSAPARALQRGRVVGTARTPAGATREGPPPLGDPSNKEKPMRVYPKDQVCGFRYSAAAWGELSNFFPLTVSIVAGPWTFGTSEALYQACKFAAHPDIQQRIAEATTPRLAAAVGRTPGLGIDPGWNAHRVDAMRWVLRMKRESNAAEIDEVLATTADRPIVEVSTHDPWWGARPVTNCYKGKNVLGRLWMELRQHLRDGDPAACSGVWLDRIHIGLVAGHAADPAPHPAATPPTRHES